jgi:hypothetical protein
VHVDRNEYLLHLSIYVNLNNLIHKVGFGHPMSKSSWEEYSRDCEIELCQNKNVVLGQFKNKKEYREFAEKFLPSMIERKNDLKKLENYTIE